MQQKKLAIITIQKAPVQLWTRKRVCEKKVADFENHYKEMEVLLKPKSSGDEESGQLGTPSFN